MNLLNRICMFLLLACSLVAQTQLDLRTQGRNVDFSSANSTRPFKTGNALPGTCTTGDTFFHTGVPAGQNWYGCVATNTWAVQSGAAYSGGSDTPLANYSAQFVAQTTVVIPGSTHALGTANLLVQCFDSGLPARQLVPSQVTVHPVNFDVRVSFAAGQSGYCVLSGGVASGPLSISSGTGLITAQALGQTTVALDTTLVPTIVTGGQQLDFQVIQAGRCAAELTFTLSGAGEGNGVAPGWPAGLEAGLFGTMRVASADTIGVRLCNFSTADVNPGPALFRAVIVRSFQ